MSSNEAIRFEFHKRLLAVDAANIELMKIVVLDLVGSEQWKESLNIFWDCVASLKESLNYDEQRTVSD